MGPLAFVCAAACLAGEEPAVAKARGAHFEIVSSLGPVRLAEEALATAEAVVPIVTPWFGAPSEERLTIELLRSVPGGGGDLDARAAALLARDGYAASASKGRAWVVLAPPLEEDWLAAIGLPLDTRLALARAAAGAIALRAERSGARFPTWFQDGALALAAERAVLGRAPEASADEIPALATATHRAQELLHKGTLPGVLALVEDLPCGLTPIERRAVTTELFRFLSEPPRAHLLVATAAAARGAAADATDAQAARRAFAAALGGAAEAGALEEAFDAALALRRPAWELVHGALLPHGDTLIQRAETSVNALAWRLDAPRAERYEIALEVGLAPGEHRQANLLLARSEAGFVQVSFVADHGVDVLRFDPAADETKRWKKLASAPHESVQEGRPLAFRVVALGRRLEVFLGEKALCALDDAGIPLAGPWGLGAYAGSTCTWRRLAVRVLP